MILKEGLLDQKLLTTRKVKKHSKNIKTEIKIAKELKNTDASLDNKDVDAAKKSLDKVDSLTTGEFFR